MIDLKIIVTIPGLPLSVPNLYEANALLQKPAGNEELPRLRPGTVHVTNMLRLPAHVERILGIVLHAIGQFEGLNSRFDLRILIASL